MKTAHIPASHVTRAPDFCLLKNVPLMKDVLDPTNYTRAFVGALDHIYVGKVGLKPKLSFLLPVM
jgi:mRNA deadenylase 3'-5' endonuclease subunit Ccr4